MDTIENDYSESIKKNINSAQKNIDKMKRFTSLFTYFSTVVATIGVVISIALFNSGGNLLKLSKKMTSDVTWVSDSIDKRIHELEKSFSQISAELNSVVIANRDSLKKIGNNNVAFAQLINQMEVLKNSVTNLEKVILDNPEKAISLLLIKQQLDNQQDQSKKDYQQTREEIARVYDMNKWIIGLVITMFLSIISLSVSNLLSKNKKE